eukprot:4528206-Heterocapsa_arctica.AAC.1
MQAGKLQKYYNVDFQNHIYAGFNRAGHYHYMKYHSISAREGTEVHREEENSNNPEGTSTADDECGA